MKLFSWVQNKLINGKQQGSNIKTNIHPTIKKNEKEEFSDWPNGFLSIGTLGNKQDLKDQQDHKESHAIQSKSHPKDLTLEEIKELQKELTAFISSNNDQHHHHHPKSLLEANNDDQQHFTHFSTIMPNTNNNAKEVNFMENKVISKKSMSFLLKKMFVCGAAGLGPTPSLRDPILSPPTTRMEKILRAILQKKIHPQSPRKTMSKNIYLENRHSTTGSSNEDNGDDEDEDEDEDEDSDDEGSDEGIKWVKTDTEYIVLEI